MHRISQIAYHRSMGTTSRRGLAIGLAIVLGSLLGLTIAVSQPPQPAQRPSQTPAEACWHEAGFGNFGS